MSKWNAKTKTKIGMTVFVCTFHGAEAVTILALYPASATVQTSRGVISVEYADIYPTLARADVATRACA